MTTFNRTKIECKCDGATLVLNQSAVPLIELK